jgi:MFS family permease
VITLSDRFPTILVLGSTQTLAWASSYYLPAVLGDPIAREFAMPSSWVFGAFSASLLLAAVLGPRVGRTIDAFGGRGVLSVSNIVLALGLVMLGLAHTPWMMMAAWIPLGIGMGLGLYDAAFAALGRIYGAEARGSITGITLIAGFASTVGWPLSAWGLAEFGWRETCFAWAAAHLLIGLPLNFFLLPRTNSEPSDMQEGKPHIAMDRNMWLPLRLLSHGPSSARWPRICRGFLKSAVPVLRSRLGLGCCLGRPRSSLVFWRQPY